MELRKSPEDGGELETVKMARKGNKGVSPSLMRSASPTATLQTALSKIVARLGRDYVSNRMTDNCKPILATKFVIAHYVALNKTTLPDNLGHNTKKQREWFGYQ